MVELGARCPGRLLKTSAQVWKSGIRKAVIWLELRLVMNVKCDKKGFYRCWQQKDQGNLDLNGLDDHRIIECFGLEGTFRSHLAQRPCSDLVTKHIRGKTEALLSSLLSPPVSLCPVSKSGERTATYSR